MQQAEFYLSIINQLQDGIYFVDTKRKIAFWNHAAEEITGYKAEEIVGRTCPESGLNHIDAEGHLLCRIGCPLYATLQDGQQRQDQVFLRHKDGHRIPVLVNIFPIRENGKITGAVEVFTQNSPTVFQGDLIDHLTNAAMCDTLTGLPNRRNAESFLDFKFQEFHRFGRQFAVLYADIDNFSTFNNTYGHDMGDAVLINIAKSMQLSVRRHDMVSRWGGEEMVGIYDIRNAAECKAIGERFRTLVEATSTERGNDTVHATISVGITAVRKNDTPESILKRADALMYQSKNGGKNRTTTDI